MTGTQSTSDEWNWCIPTSRVFETRIFVSSNFKKMRKYRFYWWSSFVYLFMIEVFNDFGLVKRIYVFWSKGDPVGPVTQSDWVPSHPVGDWNWCIPSGETLWSSQQTKRSSANLFQFYQVTNLHFLVHSTSPILKKPGTKSKNFCDSL